MNDVTDPHGHSAHSDKRLNTNIFGTTDGEEGRPRWGTAKFDQSTVLLLRLRDAEVDFTFPAHAFTELIIGRHNPQTDDHPDVDLGDHDGYNKGVSRRHAAIRRQEGNLVIVDLGSGNGTYLNGQQITPHHPRVLRHSDDIRLGHLVLRVFYQPSSAPLAQERAR